IGFLQWRTALLVRLGATSRRRPCRRPAKLATDAQRTGAIAQRTAAKCGTHECSRAGQHGPRRKTGRTGSGRAGDGREPGRERRRQWSVCTRDPRPSGSANRGVRPRHRRFTETTLDTVLWRIHHYAAHSRASPARSYVRSAPERSAVPETLRRAGEMNEKPSYFSELKRRNVYKVAITYAVAGWALAQGIAQVFP